MTTKTWFITGCSTGFGRVLTEALLKTDANVVATARKPESLSDLKGERLLVLALDVTKPETILSAVDAAKAKFGGIDVLVNNAGYGMLGAMEESRLEDTRRMFETNVFGLIQVTQAVLPLMRDRKSGYIINLSSAAGMVATPGAAMYNGTKFAVEGISEAMALEVAHLGIKVTLIEPGPFRTDFLNRSLDTQPAIADYALTSGKTREAFGAMDGKQAGDPHKAAQIIIDLASDSNPPLRMPLGHSAFDRISAKVKALQDNLMRVETIARSADFAQ
jgi:NAD(P)-dependent dehydrogenase (short-subunit alcohol dehydrogenase family)